MFTKILNVILCFLFIQWGLQFVKLSSDSNLLDMFFVSGIFILSLILFYEHHIKKPTLEFINWLYPELNLLDTISNENDIPNITINDVLEEKNAEVDVKLNECNVDTEINECDINTEINECDINTEINECDIENTKEEENEENTIEIEMKEINI
jgi:hypothetical protein